MFSRRGFLKSIAGAFAATTLRVGIGLAELAPPIENITKKLKDILIVVSSQQLVFYRFGPRNEFHGRHARTVYFLDNGDIMLEGEHPHANQREEER